MNSLGLLLLDLLRLAETPLYSSHAWLGDRVGRHISLAEFLALVQELLDRNYVRLWSTDAESGETPSRGNGTSVTSCLPNWCNATRHSATPAIDTTRSV